MSQEESSRVGATGSCESGSNESDDSFDGVDGEMQIDVAEPSVAFWMQLVRLLEG